MKSKIVILVSLAIFTNASDTSVLSDLKKQDIEATKKQNLENYDKEKYDWVNPITGSLGISQYKNYSKSDPDSKTFSISMSQPIFKSGGIYFAIKYAEQNRLFNIITTRLQEKSLVSSAYSILLNIKKIEKNIALQSFQLENAKIDVTRKLEQYNSGLIDSSYLDNAILKQSSIQTAIANLKIQLVELKQSFFNLSDISPSEVMLPTFSLMNQDEFDSTNLETKQATISYKKSDYVESMRWASYMPTVSLNASYTNKDTNPTASFDGEYYTYGVTVSMPILDMARDNVLELSRLDKLKASINQAQKLKEAKNEYDSVKQKLEIIGTKIELVQNDIIRYQSLLESTRQMYEIGEVTIYDVDTMQNSKSSKEVEVGLLKLDRQIELLNLYKKIDD